MNEIALKEKISELLREVRQVPGLNRPMLNGLSAHNEFLGNNGHTNGNSNGMKSQMATLQDSLHYLRLSIRYLVFDLEATKRENRVLRQILGGGNT